MNRLAILNTAVCYWSNEDQCYVVESPLFDRTAGVGDSVNEARQHFVEMIDASLADIKKHGLYQAPGRPAKGIVNMNVQVKPGTRDAIKQLQRKLKVSSQGEAIDYLMFFYQCTVRRFRQRGRTERGYAESQGLVGELHEAVYEVVSKPANKERLDRIEERLAALEKRGGRMRK